MKPCFTAVLLYSWDFNISVFSILNELSHKNIFISVLVKKLQLKLLIMKSIHNHSIEVYPKNIIVNGAKKSFHIQLNLHVKCMLQK